MPILDTGVGEDCVFEPEGMQHVYYKVSEYYLHFCRDIPIFVYSKETTFLFTRFAMVLELKYGGVGIGGCLF